jgi:hypothetical protein
MSDRDIAAEVSRLVARFFAAVETGDWRVATTLLAEQVQVGHGDDWASVTSEQLTISWEASHQGFAATEYRVAPLHVDVDDDRAIARLASTISLVPPPGKARPLAIVGQYTVQAHRVGDIWLIHSLHHRATG